MLISCDRRNRLRNALCPVAVFSGEIRLADLFLDPLPYNAHTTATDELWAGLPRATCAGETFAGRLTRSLLRAIGLA
jgi:predicted O-linked N-acetylglucosamine transferase (SPINDLY family)